jgi:hypothetical protein
MLRDAVEGLARDLALDVAVVEGNAGRLVVTNERLLTWLDRGGQSAGTRGDDDDDGDDGDDGGGSRRTAAASDSGIPPGPAALGRRARRWRPRARRPSGGGGGGGGERAKDVPGLDVALREWLRDNA